MASDPIERHCRPIEACNQRGGRMLSIVDLIEAGTMTAELAAYSLAAIGRGASFLVGALPGGAGKTTVMGALLNLVPADVELAAAEPQAVRDGLARPMPRRCFICHEIGSGAYYCYLWGQPLREYFELARQGHMLATNLHADTFDQARRQICQDNAVPEQDFRRIGLMYFLSIRRGTGGTVRRIESVWESDGAGPHREIWCRAESAIRPGALVDGRAMAEARSAINELLRSGARTIEEVRRDLRDQGP